MSKPFLCITGAQIATFESDAQPVQGMDLWVTDGKISAILPAGSPAPRPGKFETIALRNTLIIPGLINAHTHSRSGLMRGTTAGLPLDLNMMEAAAGRAPQTAGLMRLAILRSGMEMLKAGVTSVLDHFGMSGKPDPETVSAALNAYGDVGMRAAVAPLYQEIPYINSLPIDTSALPVDVVTRWKKPSPPELYFEMMEHLVKKWRGPIGPQDPAGCRRAATLHAPSARNDRRFCGEA